MSIRAFESFYLHRRMRERKERPASSLDICKCPSQEIDDIQVKDEVSIFTVHFIALDQIAD